MPMLPSRNGDKIPDQRNLSVPHRDGKASASNGSRQWIWNARGVAIPRSKTAAGSPIPLHSRAYVISSWAIESICHQAAIDDKFSHAKDAEDR